MGEQTESIPISECQPRYGEDLPGFRPIDYVPRDLSVKYLGGGLRRKLFIHALSADGFLSAYDDSAVDSRYGCQGRLTPLRELEMMKWMNVVTDKENWDVKVTVNRFLMRKGDSEANPPFSRISNSFPPAFDILMYLSTIHILSREPR